MNNLKKENMITKKIKTVKKNKKEKIVPKMKFLNKKKPRKNLKKKLNTVYVDQKKEEMLKKIKSKKNVKPIIYDIKNTFNNVNNYNSTENKSRLSECGFFWNEIPILSFCETKGSSSDSEDEIEQKSKQKSKKLNTIERREQEKQREREIRQREEALANNQLPNSVDQFDRLVLARPNSSIIWLQYMAYYLQTTEIEKARAVARRAVKTINFREESEKLNVWNAWLNLESKFGTSESLNDVFQEAVRSNDSLKIYSHMLIVHVEAGRQIELEKTINTIIGKFKQIPEIWINCGEALLKIGLKDKSRHIMQRALQSLPASERMYKYIIR